MFAGAVCISFSPILFKVSGLAPTPGSFWRTAIGGAVLLLYAMARGQKPFSRLRYGPALGTIVLCGVLFTLDLESWHRSIPLVGPGLATILTNFQSILLAVYGVLFFREKLTLRLAVSIPLAMAGLWLLVGVDMAALPEGVMVGVGFGLAAALWYSLYILGVRRSQSLAERMPASANMAWISLCTALCVGVVALLRGEGLGIPSTESLLWALAYGIGPQALGWLLISTGLPLVPASVAGLVILAQPTLAFIWDILLFDRPAGPLSLAGAGLALAAIYIGAVGREKKEAGQKG
ncbi:MAG: DMT family transporter [Desulfatibacillaceae bacterium]